MDEQKRPLTPAEKIGIEVGGWLRLGANVISSMAIAFLLAVLSWHALTISGIATRAMSAQARRVEADADEAHTRAKALADAFKTRDELTTGSIPAATANGDRFKAGRASDLYGWWKILTVGDGGRPRHVATVAMGNDMRFSMATVGTDKKETGSWTFNKSKEQYLVVLTDNANAKEPTTRSIETVGISPKGEPAITMSRGGNLEIWLKTSEIDKDKPKDRDKPKPKDKDKGDDNK